MPRRLHASTAHLFSAIIAVLLAALIFIIFTLTQQREVTPKEFSTGLSFLAIIHYLAYRVIGAFLFYPFFDSPNKRIWRLSYSLLAYTAVAALAVYLTNCFVGFPSYIDYIPLIYGPPSGLAAWLFRPRPIEPTDPTLTPAPCSTCTPKAIRD